MQKEAFFCSCGSNEHFFVLTKFDGEEDFVYLSVYLDRPRFLRRLVNAFKYIFGYKSKHGEFSEVCLDQETQLRVRQFLNHYDVPN